MQYTCTIRGAGRAKGLALSTSGQAAWRLPLTMSTNAWAVVSASAGSAACPRRRRRPCSLKTLYSNRGRKLRPSRRARSMTMRKAGSGEPSIRHEMHESGGDTVKITGFLAQEMRHSGAGKSPGSLGGVRGLDFARSMPCREPERVQFVPRRLTSDGMRRLRPREGVHAGILLHPERVAPNGQRAR
jgi:hypothetical protein